MNFRENALKNRYRLLVSLSYYWRHHENKGQADLSRILTNRAIVEGFCGDRKVPPGNMINTWVKKREVPAWAVKSAVLLLLDNAEYTPNTADEADALLLTLAELHPELTDSKELRSLLPSAISAQVNEQALALAMEHRKFKVVGGE